MIVCSKWRQGALAASGCGNLFYWGDPDSAFHRTRISVLDVRVQGCRMTRPSRESNVIVLKPKVIKPTGWITLWGRGVSQWMRRRARLFSNVMAIIGLPLAGLLILSSDAKWWVVKIDRFMHSRLHLEWFHLNLWDNETVRICTLGLLVAGSVMWFCARSQLDAFEEDRLQTTVLFDGEEDQDAGDGNLQRDSGEVAMVGSLVADAARLGSEYGPTAIALLAELLAEPKTYIHRLAESVEVGRRTTARSVQMDIFIDHRQLPSIGPDFSFAGTAVVDKKESELIGRVQSNEEPAILIPLAQQEKGRMYEHMEIQSRTDDQVVALSYGGTSVAAYVAVMAHLFSATYGLPNNYSDWDKKWRGTFLDLVQWMTISSAGIVEEGAYAALDSGLVRIDSSIGDNSQIIKKIVETLGKDRVHALGKSSLYRKVDDALDSLMQFDGSEPAPSQKNKLRRIAEIGIAYYTIIAQCRPAEYLNFTYSYTQPTAMLECSPPNRSEKRFRPHLFTNGYLKLSMKAAGFAKSYHMDISVKESGSYIQQAYYGLVSGGLPGKLRKELRHLTVNPHSNISVGIPYLRKPTVSGAGAHVYGRHLGRLFWLSSGEYATRIEKPPQVLDDTRD